MPNLANPETVRAVRRALRGADERRSALGTEAARAERARSAKRFHGQGSAAAVATAKAQFPRLSQPAWAGLEGEHVKRHLNAGSVVVESPNKAADYVVTSPLPILVEADGRTQPISLALADHGDHASAAAPLVPALFPDSLERGVRIVGPDIAVNPVTPSPSELVTSAGRAFYPNMATDTDFIASPLPTGVEVLYQLRSARSPEDLALQFHLPAGVGLKENRAQGGTGTDGIEVVSAKGTLATVSAPFAFDADGRPVELGWNVDGDVVHIAIPHRGADVRYPVLVDPVLVADFRYWHVGSQYSPNTGGGGLTSFDGWTYGGNPPDFVPGTQAAPSGGVDYGAGLYLYSYQSGTYAPNTFGEWYFRAPGATSGTFVGEASYIFKADFGYTSNHGSSPEPTCMINGIWSTRDNRWEPGDTWRLPPSTNSQPGPYVECGPTTSTYQIHCLNSTPCPDDGGPPDGLGSPGNMAAFGLTIPTYGNRTYGETYLGGALFHISDGYPPHLDTAPSHTSLPAGWFDWDVDDTVSASASDYGVGMGQWSLDAPGWSSAPPPQNATCATGPLLRCPVASSATFSYSSAQLPEGENTVTLHAKDIISRDAPSTWQMKIDRSGPVVSLGGSLSYMNGQTLTNGETYDLSVNATDGSAAAASSRRSGMSSIQILVDGAEEQSAAIDCPNGSCPLQSSFYFGPDSWPGGTHQIDVIASDQLNHETRRRITVYTQCCLKPAVQWKGADVFAGVADPHMYGDVTGDGTEDLVFRSNTSVWVAESTGQAFGQTVQWATLDRAYTPLLADVDGDGRDDLVAVDSAGAVTVQRSTGVSFGWGTPLQWGQIPAGRTVLAGDVDSDDLDDIAAWDPSNGQVFVARSSGNSFTTATMWGWVGSSDKVQLGDADGDGTVDLIVQKPSGDIEVGLADDTTFAPIQYWGWMRADTPMLVGDINADLAVDLVQRNGLNGDVTISRSTGSAFQASQVSGNWPIQYAFNLADVTSDGEADIVGMTTGAGTEHVAGMNAAYPLDQDTPYVSDGAVAYDETPDDGSSPGPDPAVAPDDVEPTARVAKRVPLQIGFEDEERLLHRRGDPTTTNTNEIYHRMWQAGARIVRFHAYWGDLEDTSGHYLFGSSELKTAIQDAVSGAAHPAFQVQLVLTGRASSGDCYVTGSRGCDAPTGIDPDPDEFKAFVQAAVAYFSDPSHGGVTRYGLWNEPNNSRFLDLSASHTLGDLAERYHDLYIKGYAGARAACSCARVYFGEFSELNRPLKGRHRKTPLDFMELVVKSADTNSDSDRIKTFGVNYHPYQHRTAPSLKSKRDVGIGQLPSILRQIDELWAKDSSGHRLLRTPKGHRPNLYLTEFGYLNRRLPGRTSRDTRYFHHEAERARWLRTALTNANDRAGRIRQFIYYGASEIEPNERPNGSGYNQIWDSGLMSRSGEVTGQRPYGKNPSNPRDELYPQPRAAYCALYKWVGTNVGGTDKMSSPCP